jgi:hypothetical protein
VRQQQRRRLGVGRRIPLLVRRRQATPPAVGGGPVLGVLSTRGLTSAQLGRRAYTLAVSAQNEANTITGLDAPPRYNTALRDVRAALTALINDLGTLSAAGNPSGTATASALAAVRADVGDLKAVDAALSQALGLRPNWRRVAGRDQAEALDDVSGEVDPNARLRP